MSVSKVSENIEQPIRPATPNITKLGPGPLTSWQMPDALKAKYKAEVERTHGYYGPQSTEGVLHRNAGDRKKGTTGAAGLFRDTVKLLKEVTGVQKDAKVVFIEGGHDAANTAHANFFATEPHIPVVAVRNGGFSNLWADDLKEQYQDKGFLNKVIHVDVKDGDSPTAEQIQQALLKNGVAKGAPFNITFVSNETSTSVSVPKDEMVKILNIPGRKRAVIDASSGLMSQEIPGFGDKPDGVGRRVTVFATSQKGLRGPSDYTAFFISKDDLDVINPELWKKTRIPMPKEIRIEPTELDMAAPKRSSRVEGARQLHEALWIMKELQKAGRDHVKVAEYRSMLVQNAVAKHPAFDFFVQNPKNRGSYNMVISSKNERLNKLSATDRANVMMEAHELLSDEGLAYDVKPYGNRGDIRFTTLDIVSEQEATKTLNAFAYAIDKAVTKMQSKVIDLVAEDQFLHANAQEVEKAIAAKTAELAAKGIKFIDARKGKAGENVNYTLLDAGKYLIYKPQLLDKEIAAEYEKIKKATLQQTAIIVAAKNVPAEAKFDVFVREGAGTNNIPKEQAAKDGHVVMNCPGINSKVTSDNTLNAIAGHKHIQNFSDMGLAGKASALRLEPLYGRSPEVDTAALNAKVKGKVATVLGAGDIGTQTILGLLASDAKEVRVYNRDLAKFGPAQQALIKERSSQFAKLVICDSIASALTGSNLAVNHLALVPGNGGTENAVGEAEIAKLAKGAEIVDAARPGVINPDALINAHKTGQVSRIVVDFDTPDKDPSNVAIKKLFGYARELSAKGQSSFLYSPHAFADTCPKTRNEMLDAAIKQIAEVRDMKKVHNFAGNGKLPEGLENLGAVKPDGIGKLSEKLQSAVSPAKDLETIKLQIQISFSRGV